jgi:hypothetical protein
MKGILLIKDYELIEFLQVRFCDWTVAASPMAEQDIVFIPVPK